MKALGEVEEAEGDSNDPKTCVDLTDGQRRQREYDQAIEIRDNISIADEPREGPNVQYYHGDGCTSDGMSLGLLQPYEKCSGSRIC